MVILNFFTLKQSSLPSQKAELLQVPSQFRCGRVRIEKAYVSSQYKILTNVITKAGLCNCKTDLMHTPV